MFSFFKKGSRLRKIALLAVFYACLSVAYSLLGLVHPLASSPPSEYNASRLLIEFGGHFLFGFVASLPLLDIELSMLTGALAVLIDSDHILGVLGVSTTGRPDHSILYAFVSLIVLVYAGRKLKLGSPTILKLTFIGPITLLSHISYDIFAGTGPSFPLLVPFDFNLVTLPFYFWYVLESGAMLLSIAALFVSRKYEERKREAKRVLESNLPSSSPI